MDTRKLMHYQHQHSAKHYLGYHEGDHMNPVKLATLEKGTSDSAAYELVERFNKYPDLLSQRDELADIVQELRLTLLDLGNREEFGGDAPEFNEGGDQYEALEKASAILSKLSRLSTEDEYPSDKLQARYTEDAWVQEVREGNTRRGYFDWIKAQVEQAGH